MRELEAIARIYVGTTNARARSVGVVSDYVSLREWNERAGKGRR